ncbi:phBC6A51 family helix-turn-helix protein [Vagococcus fluvialis]|uniref:phBC6A51 family helix-turn-helix protein n=1 Tax=Vagococcus fluvialis TaxID=2738 RepID=UPI003B214260
MVLQTKKQLSNKQLQAIDLLLERFFNGRLTEQAISDKVGISRRTLQRWKNMPEFNEELLRKAKEINRATLPTGLAWMNRTLNNPRAKDSTKLEIVKLLMKQAGELKDVQESTVTVNKAEEVNSILEDFKALGSDKTE